MRRYEASSPEAAIVHIRSLDMQDVRTECAAHNTKCSGNRECHLTTPGDFWLLACVQISHLMNRIIGKSALSPVRKWPSDGCLCSHLCSHYEFGGAIETGPLQTMTAPKCCGGNNRIQFLQCEEILISGNQVICLMLLHSRDQCS